MNAQRILLLLTLGFAGLGSAQAPARLWVRIVDEHGTPTASRIRLTDRLGKEYIPDGSLARQPIEVPNETFFHASGAFQMEMPSGNVTVQAVKGFEYVPVEQQVELKPKQTSVTSLVLKRWIDLPALGWYSGDVHMHPNHQETGVYMTMEDCRLYAQAEDIHVANLLISNADDARVFDREYFRDGKPDLLSTKDYLLVAQQEFRNTSEMYGHMPLLGITKLVEPFFTGERNSDHWEDYPPNYTAAKAAKDQGGAVSYTHPIRSEEIARNGTSAREFPVDLALGVVDALDINFDPSPGTWLYYHALNCGLKCAASAGSDSRMNVMRNFVSGGSKVYVKAGNPLTYAN